MSVGKKALALGLGAVFFCGTMLSVGNAANVTPGTAADPLVSKSYVDEKFSELLDVLSTSGDITINGGTYVPVQAFSGQIIIGGEGTEIILRSGTAAVYSESENGLVNATIGSDVQNGVSVGKNNIIIVPRDDNRGVKITSEDAWFIIRGSYEIW